MARAWGLTLAAWAAGTPGTPLGLLPGAGGRHFAGRAQEKEPRNPPVKRADEAQRRYRGVPTERGWSAQRGGFRRPTLDGF